MKHYTEEQIKAIADFIKAFKALKKANLKLAHYNQYTGYTHIYHVEDFIYDN